MLPVLKHQAAAIASTVEHSSRQVVTPFFTGAYYMPALYTSKAALCQFQTEWSQKGMRRNARGS